MTWPQVIAIGGAATLAIGILLGLALARLAKDYYDTMKSGEEE